MSELDVMLQKLYANVGLSRDRPQGLDGVFYTSPELFRHEKSTVLKNAWHCLGRADEISEAGDYFTTQILDDPLIVVRGDDGQIRVLANVCKHRGMRLANDMGNTKRFVCPYHAWAYARDGKLVRAAHMKNADFDATNCRLSDYACEVWHGFVYVNLSDNPQPLHENLSLLEAELEPYETQKFRVVYATQEVWKCNWKCLVENFMEGYHLSVVHPETLRSYTPTELCTKGPSSNSFTSYYANYPDDIPPRGHGAEGLTKQQRHRSYLFNVFPCQVASQAANLLVSLSLQPLSVDEVRVRWTLSVYGNDLSETEIAGRIALWTEVNREDREKLEILQETLKSSRAFSGPLAGDDFEGTISDLHQYLSSAY